MIFSRAGGAGRSRGRAVAIFVVALVLVAAAVWLVVSQRGEVSEAIGAIAGAPPGLIALALLLPLLNWIVVSQSFLVLIGRYGRVGAGEMLALIGAAWLLNYLPFKPGLVSRVAYHKAVNGISVGDSTRVLLKAMTLSGIAATIVVLIAAGLGSDRPAWVWVSALALPGVVMGVLAVLARAGDRMIWRELTALVLRYIDMLIWTGRYAVVFALIGRPVGLSGAVAVAAVSQLAMLVPWSGNGLGLREWSVGLTAGVLPQGVIAPGAGGRITAVGLAADLVNRAAELIVSVPVGLICSATITSRHARARRRERAGTC